jgi:phage recombination protein Bet
MSKETQIVTAQSERELITTLQNSLYPGAKPESVALVLSYCKAAGLDPMQKPVHIVPMWDKTINGMRDVIMPGVNLYRTQASRTEQCAGVSEPEYGPTKTENIGGKTLEYPEWCRVICKRLLPNGTVAEFPALERWKENYATDSKNSIAPNAMWTRRPFAQLAKCAEAQALRRAFPEFAAAYTADEMEGRALQPDEAPPPPPPGQDVQALIDSGRDAAMNGMKAYQAFFAGLSKDGRKALAPYHDANKTAAAAADAAAIPAESQTEEVPL